ncbi:RNA 2',3'-cyclic phosphodiesterase [Pollutimonas thiosulfatoxidans]|uniref:RNA 2',3'-cyclic phosphodiesterase n=1 Tax=Pollutimonas thiosulfatoxidans TaxID=2028345 RepID=A0A410GEU9_9BURK|nr:RNA 2',3'-cyclic phosphodiesterase [Pollutimonas thiosulfatoxidans]QAA94824.1 RNA 2',3'-cyclic phosphodiesterase [Pollutimonas thiosulfatoxidans]
MSSEERSPHRPDSAPALRLFFGLWPSPEAAAEMSKWAEDAHALCGGRVMRPDTLHITLAFLGSTSPERAEQLMREVPTWPAVVDDLILQRYGRFTGPRIVWAGPGRSDADRVPWLDSLYDELWGRLAALGWQKPASTFRPHVSLLRKAGPCALDQLGRPPLLWRPQRCVLVASTPSPGGSQYQVLAAMPLAGLQD